MGMTFQEALDALCEKYGKYGYEREFLADLLNSCNLRRPAATDADLSGRSAEPNGHPC